MDSVFILERILENYPFIDDSLDPRPPLKGAVFIDRFVFPLGDYLKQQYLFSFLPYHITKQICMDMKYSSVLLHFELSSTRINSEQFDYTKGGWTCHSELFLTFMLARMAIQTQHDLRWGRRSPSSDTLSLELSLSLSLGFTLTSPCVLLPLCHTQVCTQTHTHS